MSVLSVQTALAGVIKHQDRMAATADRVSRWRTTGSEAPMDLVRDVVDMKQSLRGAEASAVAARTIDRLKGLLLDAYA